MKKIEIISTDDNLPGIDHNNSFSSKHRISVRVVVYSYDKNGETQPCRFARYHYDGGFWNIDGITGGSFTITHYIDVESQNGI